MNPGGRVPVSKNNRISWDIRRSLLVDVWSVLEREYWVRYLDLNWSLREFRIFIKVSADIMGEDVNKMVLVRAWK